ncbi:hypothetical protein O23A_p0906 [Aeromonas salmonicida]|nr:hypothetical protein O23A_p0906 [Aeromonas salmonicida]
MKPILFTEEVSYNRNPPKSQLNSIQLFTIQPVTPLFVFRVLKNLLDAEKTNE